MLPATEDVPSTGAAAKASKKKAKPQAAKEEKVKKTGKDKVKK